MPKLSIVLLWEDWPRVAANTLESRKWSKLLLTFDWIFLWIPSNWQLISFCPWSRNLQTDTQIMLQVSLCKLWHPGAVQENSRAHTIAFALIIDWFSNQFRILGLCYSNLPSKIGNLIQLQFLSTQDSARAMTQGDGKSLEDSPRQASFVNAGSGSELGSGLGVQPEIWWN